MQNESKIKVQAMWKGLIKGTTTVPSYHSSNHDNNNSNNGKKNGQQIIAIFPLHDEQRLGTKQPPNLI